MTTVLRSLLFVPGARPDRFDKAVAAGPDIVAIDLEDAVLQNQKAEAREAVINYLNASSDTSKLCVRINGMSTEHALADLSALSASKAKPALVMIPKVESVEEVQLAARLLAGVRLIALIETPIGVLNAVNIAGTHKNLCGLMFGGADFSVAMGSDMSWDALLHARGQLALAAKIHGLDMIDVPYLDIQNEAGLRAETAAIKAMGFTGKAAIHPSQVAPINAVFSPSEAEIANARAIVEAYENCGDGALLVNNKLVDEPVVVQARRTLEIANQSS